MDADKIRKAMELHYASYSEGAWTVVEVGKKHAEEIADVILAIQGGVKACEVLVSELKKDEEAKKMFEQLGERSVERMNRAATLAMEAVNSLTALFGREKAESTEAKQEALSL